MTPNDLLKFFKTKSKIARALGCTPASVAEWFDAGAVPEGRQYQAELATDGQLRASKPALRESRKAA